MKNMYALTLSNSGSVPDRPQLQQSSATGSWDKSHLRNSGIVSSRWTVGLIH